MEQTCSQSNALHYCSQNIVVAEQATDKPSKQSKCTLTKNNNKNLAMTTQIEATPLIASTGRYANWQPQPSVRQLPHSDIVRPKKLVNVAQNLTPAQAAIPESDVTAPPQALQDYFQTRNFYNPWLAAVLAIVCLEHVAWRQSCVVIQNYLANCKHHYSVGQFTCNLFALCAILYSMRLDEPYAMQSLGSIDTIPVDDPRLKQNTGRGICQLLGGALFITWKGFKVRKAFTLQYCKNNQS